MNEYETLRTELRAQAFWISLNRPEHLNSINTCMVRDLNSAIDEVQALTFDQVRTVVITGAGRGFCAGGDLKEMEDGKGGYKSGVFLYSEISKVLMRLENLERPVIAAINGICVAGGLEIALACDLVLAADHAKFGDGHANFGLLPGGGGSVRLPRKTGINRANYMMMTGRIFEALQLEEWGLVQEVVPANELVGRVDALTAELAQKSPLGLSRMKQLVATGMNQSLATAMASEQIVCTKHDESYDRNEGLAAFASKRKPVFKGE